MSLAIKPVALENLHVTVKFLGETNSDRLTDIVSTMKTAASTQRPFSWQISGVGVFPDRRHPSVVWAGIIPTDPFQSLATELNERLRPLGFEPENRPYTPHLTLARIKGTVPEGLDPWLDRHTSCESMGSGHVDRLDLMISERTPSGAAYSTVESVSLAGVESA